MVRIIADTSTMYSSAEAREAGFDVSPLAVAINGRTYRELDEMKSETFVSIINEGHMPTSSQPAIGDVVELYHRHSEDEIINIAMADGLSGTYATAETAARMCENQMITVINSGTLCGPHRYMVETAARMAAAGHGRQAICDRIAEMKKHHKSFLLPADFDYLRRGGRLSPLVSFVGKTIKLAPVLTQSEDGRQLVMSGVKRSFKQAVSHVSKALEQFGTGDGWHIYITHADAIHLAEEAKKLLLETFPNAIFEIFPLTPAFITQGGPGCVAIQAVK